MTQDSSFEIKTRWGSAPKPGEKDLAEISICLGGRALTQLLDVATEEVRDFVRASAVSLATWCADNWWRLRWEPIPARAITADWRLRHELTSASGGTTWPPMMIYGVGPRVVLSPISIGTEMGGPVKYAPIIVSIMPGHTYEKGIDEFFKSVIATCARAQDGLALKTLVDQLNVERADPDISAWRRLEARVGYDTDAAPGRLIESLSEQENLIGSEAVEEAAVRLPRSSCTRGVRESDRRLSGFQGQS